MSKSKSFSIKPLNEIKGSKPNSFNLDEITDAFVGLKEKEEGHSSQEDRHKSPSQLQLIKESRFTIVIPAYLHMRIKKYCAVNSIPMKQAITEVFLKEFPER
jgi:hypothetical protein